MTNEPQFSNPLLDFEWEVQKDGYTCEVGSPVAREHQPLRVHEDVLRTSSENGSYLVSVETTEDQYSPLKDSTGLFKIFAATAPTEEGILEFANRYGSLGLNLQIWIHSPGQDPQSFPGEPTALWFSQITLMRAALDLRQKAKAEDTEGLEQILIWKDGDVGFHSTDKEPYNNFRDWLLTDYYPNLPVQFSSEELIGPALGFVEMIVMLQVEKFAISPRISLDPEKLKFDFGLRPHNLLSAIWLQTALALVGEKDFQRCAWCETPFEVSTGRHGARKNRRYCSDACKMRAWRAKHPETKKRRKQK